MNFIQIKDIIEEKGGSAKLICFDISNRNQCDEILTNYMKEQIAMSLFIKKSRIKSIFKFFCFKVFFK